MSLRSLEKEAITYLSTDKLPEYFKNAWVFALRSGEYTQGMGGLCFKAITQRYQYCCLGVGAAVSGVNTKYLIDRMFINDQIPLVERANVPLQLRNDTPLVAFLSHVNDREDWTFERISRWIEKNC